MQKKIGQVKEMAFCTLKETCCVNFTDLWAGHFVMVIYEENEGLQTILLLLKNM